MQGAQLQKMFYRIGEVSKLLEVEQHVVRFWEKQFRSIRPRRTASGQRVYTRGDVQVLTTVRHLLYEQRFTIEGARRYLREKGIEVDEHAERDTARADAMREGLLRVRGRLDALISSLDTASAR